MSEQELTNTPDLESRRPGWVSLAAILLALAAVFNGAKLVISGGSINPISAVFLIYFVLLFIVSAGLMQLKTWAYWAFLAVTVLGVFSITADILLFFLGLATNAEILPIQFIQLAIAIGWLIYFSTKEVREAFEVRW